MSAHIDLPHFLPWSTFAVYWFSLGVIVVLVHRFSHRGLLRLEPGQRDVLLFRLSLLPLICATAITVLSFAPGIGGIVTDRHCAPGAECTRHILVFCTDIAHAILLTAGPAILTGIAMWMLYARLSSSISLNRTLQRLADLQPDQPRPTAGAASKARPLEAVRIIETPKLFAYCAGFFRGRLIVSRGLASALTPSELTAVVAHEQAHSDRYDNARRLIALIGLWLVPQSWSQHMLRDLSLASETVCDKEAARCTGDVQTVIDAVKAIMRLNTPVTESLGAAFIHTSDHDSRLEELSRRIDELTEDSKKRLPRFVLNGATLIVYAYAIAALMEVTHHVAEYFLS